MSCKQCHLYCVHLADIVGALKTREMTTPERQRCGSAVVRSVFEQRILMLVTC